MKITHEKTKTLIIEITDLLKATAENIMQHKKESQEIETDKTYSPEYKISKLSELRNNYDIKLIENKTQINNKINLIISIEKEQENILEFDVPEFANTISVINASQGKLPITVIETIKNNFAGQYQILNTIKEIFERYGIDVNEYGYKEYIQPAETTMETISQLVENILIDSSNPIIKINKIYENIIYFGEVRGITFSENEKTFPLASKYAALGSLSMDDYIKVRKEM